MKIVYLQPLSLPSRRHVDDIVYLKKKGRNVRFLLTISDLWEGRGKRHNVFFIESEKFDPLKSATKIVVEGTIFAFGFLKKYNLSLLSIEGRVLDRCRAFDRLVSVDTHLWS
jgi:hypothetical protein